VINEEADWLRQHASVLFETDDAGRLTHLNEPEPEPAPRLFLARGRTTALVWFRADVSPGVVEHCERLVAELPRWDGQHPDPTTYAPLRQALAQDAAMTDETSGPAFRFPEGTADGVSAETLVINEGSAHLLDRFFPYTRSVLVWRSPVVAAVREGAVVSACYCARRRSGACEAGVATEEPFQGRGLATTIVQAWRQAVEAAGMTPLYSTSWDNLPSRRVAAKLGLIAYAETLSLT
jgi:GNAT superfamily N-acetyltransferase